MEITVGRTVLYKLSERDVVEINRRRTTPYSIAERIKVLAWPLGAQAHIGNIVVEGDTYPMVVVRKWGGADSDMVNGQVLLDGNDVLWVTSVHQGDTNGAWQWPARV